MKNANDWYQEHSIEVKCLQFIAIGAGALTFLLRDKSRGYQRGDRLLLRMWDDDLHSYLDGAGEPVDSDTEALTIQARVQYVLPGDGEPLHEGWCVIGFQVEGYGSPGN